MISLFYTKFLDTPTVTSSFINPVLLIAKSIIKLTDKPTKSATKLKRG